MLRFCFSSECRFFKTDLRFCFSSECGFFKTDCASARVGSMGRRRPISLKSINTNSSGERRLVRLPRASAPCLRRLIATLTLNFHSGERRLSANLTLNFHSGERRFIANLTLNFHSPQLPVGFRFRYRTGFPRLPVGCLVRSDGCTGGFPQKLAPTMESVSLSMDNPIFQTSPRPPRPRASTACRSAALGALPRLLDISQTRGIVETSWNMAWRNAGSTGGDSTRPCSLSLS